eukprot:scaffold278640_cov21-Tisochrysis_lutea.AAC.3
MGRQQIPVAVVAHHAGHPAIGKAQNIGLKERQACGLISDVKAADKSEKGGGQADSKYVEGMVWCQRGRGQQSL